jgi:F420H(2)-dependent biliverdin reductase
MMAAELTEGQRARLAEAEDVWLATVRPEGRPHLVPVWAVFVDEAIYIGTEARAQKVRNVRAHPRAAVSLSDTKDALIVEGVASILESNPPAGVMEAFQRKYDWSFTVGDGKWALVRVVPDKVHSWNTEES